MKESFESVIIMATVSSEPKNIESYQKFNRQLKHAIKKKEEQIELQKQEIAKLENELNSLPKNLSQKNIAPAINFSQIVDLESLQGRSDLMQKFKSSVGRFGMTPESIFRVADYSYRNYIETDIFVKILTKIDLKLPPIEITNLIYIFDEECTGFITKDDFNDSLNAYCISLEEGYLHYVGACVEKLAKIMDESKIDTPKFYQEMEGKTNSNVDRNRFHEKVKGVFGGKMRAREIAGAFNGIDLENDGIIRKREFVYGITSALNKISAVSNQQSRYTIAQKNSNEEQNGNVFNQASQSNMSKFETKQSSPKKELKSLENSKFVNKSMSGNAENKPEEEILQKIKSESNITLHELYEEICRTDLTKRLTLQNFKKIINMISKAKTTSPQLISQLFKSIDIHFKGTVSFQELIVFYLNQETDMTIIFHLLGIYNKNNDLNSEKFWFMHGLNADSDVSKGKFKEVMEKNFGTGTNSEIWDPLWAYFDKGRGVVPLNNIIKELSKFEVSE